MKEKRFFVLLLTLIFALGVFGACTSERINAVVNPMVDNEMNYLTTQTLSEVFLDLGDSQTEGTLFWKEGNQVLDKGENEYEWVFEPKNSSKFLGASGVVSVVAYEPLDELSVSVEDWTFGEKASEPVVKNNEGKGDVIFEYSLLGDNYFFEKTPTNAGNYVVKATVLTTKDFARSEAVGAFAILKKPLSEEMVAAIPNQIYSGEPLLPQVRAQDLREGVDFVVDWSFKNEEDDSFGELSDDFVSTGVYRAQLIGRGNYRGEVTKYFQIYAKTLENQKLLEKENKERMQTAEKEKEKEIDLVNGTEEDSPNEKDQTERKEKPDLMKENSKESSLSDKEGLGAKKQVGEEKKEKLANERNERELETVKSENSAAKEQSENKKDDKESAAKKEKNVKNAESESQEEREEEKTQKVTVQSENEKEDEKEDKKEDKEEKEEESKESDNIKAEGEKASAEKECSSDLKPVNDDSKKDLSVEQNEKKEKDFDEEKSVLDEKDDGATVSAEERKLEKTENEEKEKTVNLEKESQEKEQKVENEN